MRDFNDAVTVDSADVHAVTIEEVSEPLRNRLRTLKLQEVPGALNRAVFHPREPRTEHCRDLDPERLGLGADR